MGTEDDLLITPTNSPPSGDITSSARLLLHIKTNNVQYLVGVLIAYQMGLLDKFWSYGAGMC